MGKSGFKTRTVLGVALLCSSAAGLEDVERRLGPFTIVGQSFTIVLREKRLPAASDPNFARTLAALEIRDRSGAVLYQKAFPYQIEGAKFQRTVAASARLLPGENLNGLLIRYVEEPAATGSVESWQVFGFRNGKLGLFDRPTITGPGMGVPFAGVFMRGGAGAQPVVVQADVVELRVWTGNFRVIVPLRVDWRQGRLMPGERCFEAGGGPGLHETGCDLRLEAQHKPAGTEFSFVRMFQNSVENEGAARHVVMKKNSKVEFLKARAVVRWSTVGDAMRVDLSDLWLRVLVDDDTDKEGWIHGEEDLAAVGLPSGGRVP